MGSIADGAAYIVGLQTQSLFIFWIHEHLGIHDISQQSENICESGASHAVD